MSRLAHYIVKYRKPIIALYLVLLIPSVWGYLNTGTDYDIAGFMPSDLESRMGNEILEEKFELSGIGLMLVKDKPVSEIRELVSDLQGIDGVDEVVWPGTYLDIAVPVDFWDEETRDRFVFNRDTVLLQVLFEEHARSPRTHRAVEQIHWLAEGFGDTVLGGEPSIVNEMQKKTEEEIFYYTGLAVLAILVVLTFAIRSYLDPWLLILSVGTAVVINMGSNYFLGEISFLTDSVAAAMQLGISLNYSIFLLHRFDEEKRKHSSLEKAMESAIKQTATAITTSGVTTISSFAALMVMQHGIGQDMGVVLAKGIFFSLLVTLTFLPGLLIAFNKQSADLQHRVMLPSFAPVGRFVVKARWVLLLLFFLVVYPSILGQGQVEYYYANENYLPDDAPAVKDTNYIRDTIEAEDFVFVVTEDKGDGFEYLLIHRLKEINEVGEISALTEQVDPALPEMIIPEEVVDEYKAKGYRYMQVFISDFEDEKESFAVVDNIRETTSRLHDEYYVAGETALNRDAAILSEIDATRIPIITMLSIGLIIGLSFKSLALPVILILVIQTSIWLNMSLVYLQDLTVSSLTPIMIGAIQLGATVDYAIYFTVRYRDNLTACGNRIEALRETIDQAGQSIFTSALTLFAATIGISQLATIVATVELTMIIGRGALISMGMIFLALPSLLITFDKVIRATTTGWPAVPYFGDKNNSESGK